MFIQKNASVSTRMTLALILLVGALGVTPARASADTTGTSVDVAAQTDCEPGTGLMWTNGTIEPETAEQVQTQLGEMGIAASIQARSYGETDSCGTYNHQGIDFTITLSGEAAKSAVSQDALIDEILTVLIEHGKPNLGNVKLVSGQGEVTAVDLYTRLSSAQAFSTEAVSTDSIAKNVYVIVYDPMLSNGQTLSDYLNWNDHATITQQTIDFFKQTTNNRMSYNVVDTTIVNQWPELVDGFTYTEQQYLAVWANPSLHHEPTAANYNKIVNSTEFDICGKLNRGEIDEVWLYNGPWFGVAESRLVGPGAYPYNSVPVDGSHHCNKILPIMGPNLERTVQESVHNFTHRTEDTMKKVYGSWQENNTSHSWNKFGLVKALSPNYSYSGCGSSHFPPNGVTGYDYGNPASTPSNCADFVNYPDLGDPLQVAQPVTCSAWGCTQLNYLRYWFGHIPANTGCGPDNVANDWWKYLSNPGAALYPSNACQANVRLISGNVGIGNTVLHYVDGTPKSVASDNYGNYFLMVSDHWSGTITPSRAGSTFTPASREYADVQSDLNSQGYTSSGTAYYVNIATGDNSNSCTSVAAPCRNIQEAINKASSDDRIFVSGGTYLFSTNASPNVVILNKNLTLSGGWNSDFSLQDSASIIDGANVNNGILAVSGTVVVDNFIVTNAISANSGAIYIVNGNFTLTRSTLKNNRATSRGAGIFLDNGVLNVMNSTISGNYANSQGGGIYVANNAGSVANIQNSTIAYNSASTGGGVSRTAGTLHITNTIIAKNSGLNPDCSGILATANSNIIENPNGCSITTGAGNLNVDSQIDAALTGTMPVHMLLPDSPAINAATSSGCPVIDQIGTGRPQGSNCDIGSVEFSGTPSDITPPAVESITRLSANPTSVAQADFLVTFSESVTGVDAGDFSLTTSGLSGAAVNIVSGSGNLYTVRVDTGSGAGTIRLDVADDDSILDVASNPLGGAGIANGTFNAGESYTVTTSLTLTLNSIAAHDGWILESSESSNAGGSLNATTSTFNVGDDKKNRQYAGILHFDTSSLPDTAVITSIALRVQRQSITGADPFTTHGSLVLDIQKPYFGTTVGLVAGDFQAAAGQADVSTFDPSPVNNWYRATLDSGGYAYIDLTGTTQFRLRFSLDDDNDITADIVKFYSGEATAANGPQLIVQYYVPQTAHVISGNVGVGGASVSYFDGTAKTVATDDSGNYSVQVSDHWSGTITPNRANYVFVPDFRNYAAVQQDLTEQNYTAVPLYTISGNLRYSGVTLSYLEDGELKTVVSNSSGNYSLTIKSGWSGTVTPSKPGVLFEPTSRSYVDLQSNQTAQDYTASIRVTTLADNGPGSLRQAIVDSNAGDTITFDPSLSGQTITLASTVDINKSLTIDGSALASKISISGNNSVRVLSIPAATTVIIRSLIITNGHSASYGAGIYNDGVITVVDSVFSNNVVLGNDWSPNGGAIANLYGTLTVVNSVFSANQARYTSSGLGGGNGGAIYSSSGLLTISDSTFSGNDASHGGAIGCQAGTMTITNSTFSSNHALAGDSGEGGAIFEYCQAEISNSTFSENSSSHGGGAILSDNDTNPLIVTNSTFYNNTASQSGGGIAGYGQMIVTNSTFSHNAAVLGGAIRTGLGGSLTLRNSILANSVGGVDCIKSDGAYPVENTNNLIETTGTGFESCGVSLLSTDPLLATLSDNGGLTQTMAILRGSPAIDAGDIATCTSTDQRGMVRPEGGPCDLGAYEADYVSSTRYVKGDASGANNGSSWTDAYTDLQSALSAASSGDQIWVAAGTYKPTSGTDRTASFVLKNDVAVYGGFAGTETSLSQREYQTNITTLSGDIGAAGDNSDNSYHVVIGSNTNDTAVFDGFTVTGGNANVSPSDKGGGMYNFHGSPSLTNLIITGNYATFGGGMNNESLTLSESSNPNLSNVSFINNTAVEGGGMRNMNYSSPTLENVKFQNNTVLRAGGGMVNMYQNNVNMLNVEFSGNTAGTGGGLANAGSNPILENVTFSNNSAEWGGAISNGYSSPTITNATFYGNSATAYGGAISNESNSNPTLTNVTISGNSAVTYGGGIYNDYNGGSIRNSIIYGNTGGAIYNSSGNAVVSYSIVEGGYTGTGNLDIDPLLLSLQDNGGFTETMAILSGSPAIDAGNDTICPDADQRGITRPQGSHCDIGAHEAHYYTISGNVGAPGVILSYADTIFGVACIELPDGSLSCTNPQSVPASKFHYVTSDQDGNYSFQNPQGWIGTVVPSKPGYVFSPVKRTYYDLSSDQVAQDYTASVVDSVLPPDTASTRRVVPADAVPSDNPLNFEYLDISGNGRYVAYVSNSPDLVPGDTNERSDVFVWDRLTNTTQRISVNSGGEEANDHSFYPSLSKDGRYVAFESWSTNLDTACTWGRNVFVHDTQTGTTICASVNASGERGGGTSDRPMISADGRYVVYKSFANNLVSGDTNNQWDVFVFDILSRTTVHASVSSTGVQGNSYSENAAISGDGRYVAFISNATTLVSADTNGSRDIFVRDMLSNTTSRVSVSSGGAEGNGISFYPTISEDGRLVAFASFATNLVDGDTNASTDVFVHDTQTATTSRVSLSSNNAQGNDISTFPTISGDGRFVVFQSEASNLVSNDISVWTDIFVRNLLTSKTSRVSVASDGTQANNNSTLGSLSSDGRYVVFESRATNLVSPVVPNRYQDAYLHERDTIPPTALSVTRVDSNPTLVQQVDFQVTFSENVTGVDVSDFSLTASGPSGAAVNTVSGSGNLYTVSVGTGSGAGTIRLDVVDDDSIVDSASNPLGGVGLGNGDFNLGEFYTIPQILTLNLNSVAANDGSILESAETSNLGGTLNATLSTIDIGDDKSNKQSVGILHFDTSSLPDNAVITSVTLQVQKQNITGTDPFTTHGSLVLDVQKPYFGTTAGLLTSDFNAAAGGTAVSTIDPTPVNNWYSAIVDNEGYVYIDLTGTTQFRLRFTLDDNNDRGMDIVKFFSGEVTAANRPQLIIQYYIP